MIYDLLVIGGGINGCGIARDAAGRGLKVLLVEQDDLARHTSSASTKLIHGGLRYLEYYEFRLVREALSERERLLHLAPHIIWPLRFVLPHDEGLRPAWMIRLGLLLYDHLGGRRSLPGSAAIALDRAPEGAALQKRLRRGFVYSDAWVEDSRLVALNAMGAREKGAVIRTRTRLLNARRAGSIWQAEIEDTATGLREQVAARILVNASGPWVSQLLSGPLGIDSHPGLRLVKGSHIIVPKLFEGAHAYIFQNPDGRIIFAIPYEGAFTLIGTTDVPHEAAPGAVSISDAEIVYLCDSASRYFTKPVVPTDVVWSYAGVRPLYDDAARNASAVTRDYVLDIDAAPADGGEGQGTAPVLSVFGGKITTFRRLAEHALEKLSPWLPGLATGWTAGEPLPGGDMPPATTGGAPAARFEAFLADLQARKPFLPQPLARRLARAYGTRVEVLLGNAVTLADLGPDVLGEHIGLGLSRAEVDYLAEHEWACTAQDILWRRSKIGLHLSREQLAAAERTLDGYLAARVAVASA